MLYGYFIEPYWVQVNTISIKTDKLKNATFRVVQISDMHCDKKIRLEKKLPTLINGLNPDIIVFTGDCLNRESALLLFQNTLAKMNAPLGKFAVTGNWDFSYWSNPHLFDGTGFEELRLHKKIIEKDNEFITVAGLAFENGRHSQNVIRKLKTEAFNLFLYHNTDLMDYFHDKPIDLYLCGHTHGGQVALPVYGALITLSRHGKKYEAGLYRQGHIQLYVNRGIGMDGGLAPRVRFFARPEITVFDIGPQTP
jgi:predicted MPP superfamily phosphohydrolase